MKVMTVLGTRPEIIRLSVTVPLLDRSCDQVLVHTGQNYDETLSEQLFRDLGLRNPDLVLGIRATNFADQIGQILTRISEVIDREKPDRILILGDTNSGLAAIIGARRGIPVYHMEAGNRCFDDRVPEEVNRRIIDHCSTVLMPYTHRSKENLLREGIEGQRIFVIGNPIFEVLETYRTAIDKSTVLTRLGLKSHEYFLATLHRAENVDEVSRLRPLLEGLGALHEKYGLPVVVSLHPHTADRMSAAGLTDKVHNLLFLAPLGFFDFVSLEKNARGVVTDSGTVQEECCILRIPNITLRDTTERPETLECGSNILTGIDKESILSCMAVTQDGPTDWAIPREYTVPHVSTTVAKILLGHPPFRREFDG